MMDAIRNAVFLVALGVSGASPAVAAAGVQVYTSGAPSLNCSDSNNTGALLSTSCSNGVANASASGFADYRHVGVSASTLSGSKWDPFAQTTNIAHADASAGVSDLVTVSSAGRSGAATLSFSFTLLRSVVFDVYATPITTHNGTSQGAGGADLFATLGISGQQIVHTQQAGEVVRRGTTTPEQREYHSVSAINGALVATSLGTYSYDVPIVLDKEFPLLMSLRAHASSSASGNAGGAATLNSMNSFDWGGVQRVTFEGRPVEFSVSSVSGTDWAQAYTPPIPEAPTTLLLLGGLGVVLRRAIRAKARHASRRPE